MKKVDEKDWPEKIVQMWEELSSGMRERYER